MATRKIFLLSVLIFVAVTISGCFNYEQETILNSDMSGVIKVHLFPNQKDFDSLANALQDFSKDPKDARELSSVFVGFDIGESDLWEQFNWEAIKSKRIERIKKEDGTHIYIMIAFTNISDLYKNNQKINVFHKDNVLVYEENVNLFCSEQDYRISSDKVLKGPYTNYTLHMPGKIVEANTDTKYKDKATWHFEGRDSCRAQTFRIKATSKSRHKLLQWIDDLVSLIQKSK